MRCQKVRSCLSAFCNDELTGSAFAKVSDHLATCAGCQAEEQYYRAVFKGSQELKSHRVSEGFNNRLLERIAHERFAETRSRAYFPKNTPLILVRRVIPILATTFLVVAVVTTNFLPKNSPQPESLAVNNQPLDDSYLTAQPVNNPNMTGTLKLDWTLDEQLARSDRMDRISRQLTFDSPFNYFNQGNALNVSTSSSQSTPFVDGYYRVRPVITVFEPAAPNINKEAEATY